MSLFARPCVPSVLKRFRPGIFALYVMKLKRIYRKFHVLFFYNMSEYRVDIITEYVRKYGRTISIFRQRSKYD